MANQEPISAQEVGSGLALECLPAYEPMLTAFHRACGAELRQMVDQLPLQAGERVLDMACGDGTYARWLAERVGSTGSVVAVDIAPAYLELARQATPDNLAAAPISWQVGSIEALPFPDDHFDLAWCAHSLYSLPDPLATIRELCRVVRPGGIVGILENDTVQHMLLPWPAELELAVRQAQLAAFEASPHAAHKFYVGRHLGSWFDLAGLTDTVITTHTIDHRAPLSNDERIYFEAYIEKLAERARPQLDAATRTAFDLLLQPESNLYLLNRPDFFASHLEIMAYAKKPNITIR